MPPIEYANPKMKKYNSNPDPKGLGCLCDGGVYITIDITKLNTIVDMKAAIILYNIARQLPADEESISYVCTFSII
jgi:hypothetical protein